ncbi:MAG: cytochrome c oxidase subunit 3 [Janthinobacterium lividum]
MDTTEKLTEKEVGLGWHPQRVILILLIFSFLMVFAGWTSGYIVRRDEGNWREFDLPRIFILSTVLVTLSSAAIQWAYYAAKKDEIRRVQIGLALTLGLGLAFLFSQWAAWTNLVHETNTFFGGADANPSGSFLYVLTGWHAFHIVSGLIFVAVVLWRSLKYQVHSRAMLSIGNAVIYWHFLGILWWYLYLFLLLNH